MNQHTLIIFCVITMTQTFSIGPAVAVLLTNYLNFGLRSSIFLSIAFRCGESLTLLAAFLITSVFNVSPIIFTIMKGVGGGYLVFIGFKSVLKMNSRVLPNIQEKRKVKVGVFSSFLIPILNPKALIYFTSFIPSFISPRSSFGYGVQFSIFGALFVLISFVSDMCFVGIASGAKKVIGGRFATIMPIVSGVFLVGTGLFFVLNSCKII